MPYTSARIGQPQITNRALKKMIAAKSFICLERRTLFRSISSQPHVRASRTARARPCTAAASAHREMAPAAATSRLQHTSTAAVSQSLSFDQTQYQEKARKLVTLVNALRDAGAQFSLDLPCMVVCGNQSAGKSSLLERLCGVKLPRAAGTCTKCPTEVRLSTSPPGGSANGVTWCCQIKLRREYGKDNKQLDPKPKEEAFKMLTQDDKEQLHLYISAAQRALLNPDTPSDLFAKEADRNAEMARSNSGSSSSSGGSFEEVATGQQDAEEDALKFTRNVIVLEITGADVDLALIDLPGIIQTEQGDDKSNVELVKQLVEHYISSDRAIIVAAITCKDDIDNQAIVQMARAVDKEGHRTIGVLTKADMIEDATHNTWLQVLQGTTFPLALGYFCVVNPSQADLNAGMTQEQAAVKEDKFFEQDPFFGSERVAPFRSRCGVDALRVQLSKQLVALTQRELPKMKQALEEAVVQVEQLNQALPKPPAADPTFELCSRLRDLAAAVNKAVKGEDDAVFFKASDACYRQFREAVLVSRPTVRLTDSSYNIVDSGKGEEDPQFWLSGPQSLAQGKTAAQPVDGLITMDSVRELANKYRVRELPTFAPYRVLEELVDGMKGRWDTAALACVHGVAEELQQLTDALVEEHFGQFAAARHEIRGLLYEMQEDLLSQAEGHVKKVMAMEGERVYTQNDHYLSSSMECFEAMLIKQLYGNDATSKPINKQNVDYALSSLNSVGIELSAQDLDVAVARKQQQGSGQDEGLLELIAGTLAYFKVSSKRVIDGVPMNLHHDLLLGFAKELNDLPAKVASGMSSSRPPQSRAVRAAGAEEDGGNNDDDGDAEEGEDADGSTSTRQPGRRLALDAARLMAEDESTAQRRAQLQRQLQQLRDVRKILSVF